MKKQLLKISACAILLALFSISFAAHVAPIRTLVIPAATGAMTIDGVDDETFWSDLQTTDAFNKTGCADYPSADFTFAFKVCYDLSNLYVFGTIEDETDNSSPVYDGNIWTFDNAEPFIDLDTNGSGVATAYDSNTIQLRISRGLDSVQTNGRAPRSAYELYWENTSSGWLFEVAIPWKAVLAMGQETEDIMQYVAEGVVSGFDMSGADSDAAAGTPDMRDCQTGWDNDDPSDDADRTEDNAWNNRSVFGIVTFEPIIVGTKVISTDDATVFPNPTTGSITFSDLTGINTVEIMNLAGNVVIVADVTNTNTVDMSQLASGIYVAKVGQNFVKVIKK